MMINRYGTFIQILCFFAVFSSCNNPNLPSTQPQIKPYSSTIWARTVFSGPNSGDSIFNHVAVDGNKNIYAVGSICGTSGFNFGHSASVVGQSTISDAVLVKYSDIGIAQWVKSIKYGAFGNSKYNSVACDSNGYVYVVGYLEGTNCSFGNGVTITGTVGNAIMVKYSSDGLAQWAIPIVQNGSPLNIRRIRIDSEQNIYLIGYFSSAQTLNFGNNVSATGTSMMNPIIIKYNKSGIAQWAQTINYNSKTVSPFIFYNHLTIDKSGNIYAVGRIYGTITYGFGNNIFVTNQCDGYSFVIVKYNKLGIAQWAKAETSNNNSYSNFCGITINDKEELFVVGFFAGVTSIDLGKFTPATNTSDEKPILVKYNTDGVAQWARSVTLGSGIGNVYYDVACDNKNGIFVIGRLTGPKPFSFGNDNDINTSSTNNSIFVKYDNDGTPIWAQTSSGATIGESIFYGASIDSAGDVYAVGSVTGNNGYDFGNGQQITGISSSNNALIVKYGTN